MQLCQLAKTKRGFLVSPQWAAGSLANRETQGRILSWASRPPSNREDQELKGQEKRSTAPPPPSPHTSGDWKIWSVSPSIRAIKKVISPLPWKPRTEMWKGGNSFPCGYILMWPVHFSNEARCYCWEYHLVGLSGKVISGQLKSYFIIKNSNYFYSWKYFLFCYQLNASFKSSGQIVEDAGSRESFPFSFLSLRELRQEMKSESVNNEQFVLDSSKCETQN